MADVGNGVVDNATLTFSDAAPSQISDQVPVESGVFQPTDYPPTDALPLPGPPPPYASELAAFNGFPATGDWTLYVNDDGMNDEGAIDGGWSLTVATALPGGAPPTISSIPNQATARDTPTLAIPFTIDDADTPVANLLLSGSSSNPTLVPDSNINLSGIGPNRIMAITPAPGQTGAATIVITVSDGNSMASSGFILSVTGSPIVVEPVLHISLTGDIVEISFDTQLGATYAIEGSDTLLDNPNWKTLTSLPGTGGARTVTDNIQGSVSHFYRIRVE
jgi:hypothetical protein